MEVWAIITGAAVIVGIVAGIVQVVQYMEGRRKEQRQPATEEDTALLPPETVIPNNIPARGEFIGREQEKARVLEALASRWPLTCIDGIGGIGKTALALEVAGQCLRASRGVVPADGVPTFNGFIWTTAKDRELTLNDLLDAVARTLDYPGIAQQPLEEKQDSVRKLLQSNSYLLLVDNFETVTDEAVRDFLLRLPEPSKALITSREQKLRQAWAVSLKGLEQDEALALIRSEGRRLGLASLEKAEEQVLLRLYQATGGAPLAIKWAVGQIKQKGQSLDIILTALHGARGSIFDNIFACSWELLSADARKALLVTPLFATSASRAAIEAASDVHHFALDEALGQLVEMSLLDATDELELARRRYNVHPLTRAFSSENLKREAETEQAAQKRLADYYQLFAREHGGFWNREGDAHLEPELPNMLAVIQRDWRQHRVHPGVDILHNISDFMVMRGYWNDLMELGQQAITLASEAGHELHAARFREWPIAWIHRHRGNLDLAEDQVTKALSVYERLGDEQGSASAKRQLGRIAQERGDFGQAEQLLREALAFYQATGDERLSYFLTANLADVALEQGHLDMAWALCAGMLPSVRRTYEPELAGLLLTVLGRVARQRGDLQQAKVLFEEVLGSLYRMDEIANVLLDLAQIEIQLGQTQEARSRLLRALEIYRRLDIQSRVREIEELLTALP